MHQLFRKIEAEEEWSGAVPRWEEEWRREVEERRRRRWDGGAERAAALVRTRDES